MSISIKNAVNTLANTEKGIVIEYSLNMSGRYYHIKFKDTREYIIFITKDDERRYATKIIKQMISEEEDMQLSMLLCQKNPTSYSKSLIDTYGIAKYVSYDSYAKVQVGQPNIYAYRIL